MTTARNIIEAALRKLAALGSGESLAAEDAQDGLQALNAMLSSWSVEGDLVYQMTRETFTLTGGTSAYTIGLGQTFNTERPLDIYAMNVSLGGISYPVDQSDERQFATIQMPAQSGRPYTCYYNSNSPIATLNFYYVPNTTYTFEIYSRKVLTEFSTINTDLDLPPGYEKALIYNLAIELSPEYEREPSPTVMREAGTARSAISSQNNRNQNNAVGVDTALVRMGNYYNNGFNIYSGN